MRWALGTRISSLCIWHPCTASSCWLHGHDTTCTLPLVPACTPRPPHLPDWKERIHSFSSPHTSPFYMHLHLGHNISNSLPECGQINGYLTCHRSYAEWNRADVSLVTVALLPLAYIRIISVSGYWLLPPCFHLPEMIEMWKGFSHTLLLSSCLFIHRIDASRFFFYQNKM